MIQASVTAGRRSATTTAIVSLFERRTGQRISPSRAWRLETALQPILRDLGLDSLDMLVQRIAADTGGELAERVVDALLNQETSFFRDAAVLDQVGDAMVARHAAAPGRRLRIWSAGCSTGQEPLSLAILASERGIDAHAIDIVATDVSAEAVSRARAARFTQFEIQRGLAVRRMMTWFDGDGDAWSANRALLRAIQVRRHNLVEDAPPAGAFDLILCRNVLLYFSPEVRRAVFARLASAIAPGGLLVLGAGETVIGQTELFEADPAWRGFYCRAGAHG